MHEVKVSTTQYSNAHLHNLAKGFSQIVILLLREKFQKDSQRKRKRKPLVVGERGGSL
jgi:hypothetical protein